MHRRRPRPGIADHHVAAPADESGRCPPAGSGHRAGSRSSVSLARAGQRTVFRLRVPQSAALIIMTCSPRPAVPAPNPLDQAVKGQGSNDPPLKFFENLFSCSVSRHRYISEEPSIPIRSSQSLFYGAPSMAIAPLMQSRSHN